MLSRGDRRACILALALGALLSGCVFRVADIPADDYHDWSAVPLAPDPALAQRALEGSVCGGPKVQGNAPAPIHIVLQDRRTAKSAAFLVASVEYAGDCLVQLGSGTAGGGGQTLPLPAMTGAIAIDDAGLGGEPSTRVLGGRLGEGVASVTVTLADGRTIVATVGNGHWLTWWPGDTQASVVTALDASGAIIDTAKVGP